MADLPSALQNFRTADQAVRAVAIDAAAGRASARVRDRADIAGDFAAGKRAADDRAAPLPPPAESAARRPRLLASAAPRSTGRMKQYGIEIDTSRWTRPTASAMNSPVWDFTRTKSCRVWPRAHPEMRFDFCYRPHRYLRARRAPTRQTCAGGCWPNRSVRAAPTSSTGSTSGCRASDAPRRRHFSRPVRDDRRVFHARVPRALHRPGARRGRACRRHHRGLRVHQEPGGVAAGCGSGQGARSPPRHPAAATAPATCRAKR